MLMAAKVPIRLRVLVPAVENCVDSRSYRNGDIIRARNGKTSEITSTGKKKLKEEGLVCSGPVLGLG